MIYKINAFLLLSYPYKTSSLINHFLTESDIISAFSYSAKKEGSKFGSDLNSVSKLEIIYYADNSKNINTLKETSILKNYSNIERDNYSLFALSYIKEIIFNVAKDYDERYFIMFESMLDSLSKNVELNKDDNNRILYIKLLLRAFEIKTLHIAGISPNISGCLNCREPNKESYFFSFEDSAIVCKDCLSSISYKNDLYHLDYDVLEFFRIIKYKSFNQILEIDTFKYKDIANTISKEILLKLLYNHTGKVLKSSAIVDNMLE